MDKSHSLSSLMGVYLLEVNKHLFHPKEDNKELLGLEVHDQMYLTNYT